MRRYTHYLDIGKNTSPLGYLRITLIRTPTPFDEREGTANQYLQPDSQPMENLDGYRIIFYRKTTWEAFEGNVPKVDLLYYSGSDRYITSVKTSNSSQDTLRKLKESLEYQLENNKPDSWKHFSFIVNIVGDADKELPFDNNAGKGDAMWSSPFKFKTKVDHYYTGEATAISTSSEEFEELTEPEVEDVIIISTDSYGEPGEFELCKDLEDMDIPPICPDCKPNPAYIEPNIVYHKGSYYNEKTCEYVIVMEPQDGSVQKVANQYGGDIKKYIEEHEITGNEDTVRETVLHYGLKTLAKDNDKTQINGYFVGPVDELLDIKENPVELPLRTFTRIEWAVIPDTGQIKVKLSVQKRYFELLPADEAPEPSEGIQAGQEEIVLDATKFYAMMLRARAGIKVHQKFYEVHLLKAKGYLYKVSDEYKKPVFSSDLDSLRRDLKTFRKQLFQLIRGKGYRVNSFESSLPFANKKVDKIKIKFDNTDPDAPYKIKAISVKPIGCRYRQIYNSKKDSGLLINGDKPIFLKNPKGFIFNPFAIIGNINDIDDDLQAYEPPTWEEFLVKYLAPSVALEYGTLNSPLQDRQNSLACAMDQFPSFGDFLKSSLFSLETVFELLAYEFNRITCAEDTEKAIADFNKRFGSQGKLIDQFKSAVDPNSGIASYLLWALSSDMTPQEIIGSLSFCELDGLLKLILECMLGGIPFEQALQKIVTKLISSLTARHIGKLIGFLPASKQAEIEDKVQAIIGAPVMKPWSSNFAGGVVQDSKPSGRYKNMKSVSSQESVEAPFGTSQPTAEDIPDEGFEFQQPEAVRPGETQTFALVTQDLSGATPEQVAQMNVDSKVSQVATVILEAYIEALMEVVPIDDLITYIDKLPITPLIRTLIVAIFNKCQTTPLSSFSDIGMMIPKFKIDVCDPMLAIRIPKIPTLYIPSGIPDLMKLFREMLIKIAISVFTKMLLSFLLKILKGLDNILCQGFAALARDDGDFADIFGNLLCDSTPDKARDLLKEMVESMRGLPPSLAGDNIECIFASFSRTLSRKEMLMIASGNPVDKNVYERVARSIALSCPDYAPYFPDGESVSDLCKVFPSFLPESERRKAEEMIALADDSPICDLVCLNKQQLNNWDALRQNQLEDMGMSPEQAAEEIDKLNDIALQEFDDMLSAGVGMQDMIAEEFDKLLNRPEQCDEASPWNTKPEAIAKFSSNVADYIFTPIEMEFYRELTGKRKSILSRILSDTRGNTYNAHRFFASSIFSRWYYKDFKKEGANFLGISVDTTMGHFPKTIGEDLRVQLLEPEEPLGYKTDSQSTTRLAEVIEIGDIEVLNHYKNDKKADYLFEYSREDNRYRSVSRYINSINAVEYPYEPLENFGYTLKTIENGNTRIIHQKIDNALSTAPPISGTKPYAVKYFEKYLTTKTLVNSTKADSIYDNIFGFVFDFVNTKIISGDGFVYGAEVDELSEDDIKYLNPNGGEYNQPEEAKILGKSDHPRVLFLDPKIHGGSYTQPKIFIKPVTNKGWLSLYDAFSNFDPACDDVESKILPFNDIKKYHDSLLENLPVDKRLYQDPDCRKDIPFDRIFTTEVSALVDAIVRSTILCHAVDASINTMPLLLSMKWKSENYDSMFSQILFDKMKSEMLYEIGRSRTKNNKKIRRHRYWCLFIEQVAQAFQRQVDLGMIVPTEAEESAMREIFLVRKRYKYPTREDIRVLRGEDGVFNMKLPIGDFANFKLDESSFQNPETFYKYAMAYDEYQEDLYNAPVDPTERITVDNPRVTRLKRFRLQTKVYAIRTVESSIRVLFDRITRQEMERYVNRLQKIVPPKVNDIRHYMFHQAGLFIGSSLNIGTTASEELYSSGQRTGFGQIMEPEYDTDLYSTIEVSEEKQEEIAAKGCLIVERYVRIEEKAVDPNKQGLTPNQRAFLQQRELTLDQTTGPEQYYGIVKLKDFREYIQNTQLIKRDKKLSHYFGEESPAHFGIRISYMFPDEYVDYDAIKSNTRRNKLMKSYKRGDKTIQPLASFEHPFIDETVEQFLGTDSQNNYDNHCLVKNLVKTEDFSILFEKMIPIKAPVSFAMATLYTSFYNSIGAAADGWDPIKSKNNSNDADFDDGILTRGTNDADQFENIEKGALKTTKKLLQKSFQAAYRDQEFDEEESKEHKRSMFGFLKNMIPDLNLNLGKFGNRVVKDLDDCDDPVLKLLRK